MPMCSPDYRSRPWCRRLGRGGEIFRPIVNAEVGAEAAAGLTLSLGAGGGDYLRAQGLGVGLGVTFARPAAIFPDTEGFEAERREGAGPKPLTAEARAMPLIDEDDRPKKKIVHEMGQDLALLSVKELQERIALLKEEIGRLDGEIARKQASRNVADQFFKKS